MKITQKKIEAIYTAPPTHMVGDGFRVHNFIPHVEGLSMQDMDRIYTVVSIINDLVKDSEIVKQLKESDEYSKLIIS